MIVLKGLCFFEMTSTITHGPTWKLAVKKPAALFEGLDPYPTNRLIV